MLVTHKSIIMKRYFNIQLKWIDDDIVASALVTDYDDYEDVDNTTETDKDVEIFWFGISETQIQHHIKTGEPVCNQFVILDYTEVEV